MTTNPVRDVPEFNSGLVEPIARVNRRAVGTRYINITYLTARLAMAGGIFYQYCVPNGTCLDRLATPVFYDKNCIADYQWLTRSSERDWAMPYAIDFATSWRHFRLFDFP